MVVERRDVILMDRLIKNIKSQGGVVSIAYDPDLGDEPWVVGSQFGREAEDSPMAGGATYGVGSSMEEALGQAAEDL